MKTAGTMLCSAVSGLFATLCLASGGRDRDAGLRSFRKIRSKLGMPGSCLFGHGPLGGHTLFNSPTPVVTLV
jgi:hypothetical protein